MLREQISRPLMVLKRRWDFKMLDYKSPISSSSEVTPRRVPRQFTRRLGRNIAGVDMRRESA